MQLRDPAAIDDLFSSLRSLAWERTVEDEATGAPASITTLKLHEYQVCHRVLLRGKPVADVRQHTRCRHLVAVHTFHASPCRSRQRCPPPALQIVSLANLNPGTVAAARSLIPSLAPYSDEEVGEMLAVLRRASAKYTGLDAAAPPPADAGAGGSGGYMG